jgi:ATP-dependent DNA ligase
MVGTRRLELLTSTVSTFRIEANAVFTRPWSLLKGPEESLFEIKWDGFRSLVRLERGKCRQISRKGNEFKSFPMLNAAIAAEINAKSALLDGVRLATSFGPPAEVNFCTPIRI